MEQVTGNMVLGPLKRHPYAMEWRMCDRLRLVSKL